MAATWARREEPAEGAGKGVRGITVNQGRCVSGAKGRRLREAGGTKCLTSVHHIWL